MIEYSACSVKGQEREMNQERILVNHMVISAGGTSGIVPDIFSAVVCGGCGTGSDGAAAAEMIAGSFLDLNESKTSALNLSRRLHKANRNVQEIQKRIQGNISIAAAAAGIILFGNNYLLFHLGSARIYEVKDGRIYYYSQRKPELKGISPGAKSELQADFRPSFRKGTISEEESIFMICSDGVYDNISKEKIRDVLVQDKSIVSLTEAILQLSLQNGFRKDRSILMIKNPPQKKTFQGRH